MIMVKSYFSDNFRKIIICHKCIGYDLNVVRQSAFLVITQSRLITTVSWLITKHADSRMTFRS